jgi:cation transporter-like permease
MANIIRAVFAIFWLVATGFLGFLAYIVTQTEGNPQILWAWLMMCAFTFISATFLAYTIIFGHHERDIDPLHHSHLNKA